MSIDLSTGYEDEWAHWISVAGQSPEEVQDCGGNTISSEELVMVVTSEPSIFVLVGLTSVKSQFMLYEGGSSFLGP